MIGIIDYNAGNLRSVQRACSEVGASAVISAVPEVIARSHHIIFPGVGAAGSAMSSIRESEIDQCLREQFEMGTPILGICMGMQISLSRSEEDQTDTIDLLPGQVIRFQLSDRSLKVPHMGWNEVSVAQPHPVLASVVPGDEFYFVHSFYPEPTTNDLVYATTEYETVFCSALGKDNFFGTQFHPEKSGRIGLQLLRNFLNWDGSLA